MTTKLLFISLLLHVVAFYFIIVLYTKYSTIKDLSNSQRAILDETETSMTSFLIEMKDENERLIQHLKQESAHITNHGKELEAKTKESNHPTANSTMIHTNEKVPEEPQESELPDYLSELNEIEDIVEISQPVQKKDLPFEIQAINLYENGHTVEQIAKKLSKGKTEIELLLKFRQK
ncbi:hypothetical protein [Metabacillus litoralis]|uniref:Swarming motility protein SwrB n=1 Tax=Metabacillus litoralis TaxID=152268 RepID=A0A179SPB6_9BACI|nr:hypothetical protein [Metabacillus litoralis]OAS83311.1 hypothetical protein A6K24_09340 [Metabacillus litoralis]